MKRWSLLLTLFVSCAGLGVARGQNLIQNGDFDTGDHAPLSTITNWIVSGTGAIHSKDGQGTTSGMYAAAFNVGGDSQGTVLSQSFSTVAGGFYQLDFDTGIYGQRSGAPLRLRVQVIDTSSNSVILDQMVVPPDAGTFNAAAVAFGHYTFSFAAGSASTTLQFTDVGAGNQAADTMVDTVSVVASTPLPATGPNLTTNGDFETPPFGESVVTGWNGQGNVADYSEGATSGNNSGVLSAGADSEGDMLWQSVPTIPGHTYFIDFDAA